MRRALGDLSRATIARRIAYASSDPVLFPGSMRENLLYGLRKRPPAPRRRDNPEHALHLLEAKRTGNPLETTEDDWLDLERSGAGSVEELDHLLLDYLHRFGLRDDVYRFGISGMVDPVRQPALAERIVEARERLRELLQERGMGELVEPFDPERYNDHATVGENLLFGVPLSSSLIGRNLAENVEMRTVLDEADLTDDLVKMGASIAETMVDIFDGLPAGHPLFEQFSFVHADELAEFAAIAKRSHVSGRGGLTRDDRTRLLALPLAYIEPRHRLGLLDDKCRAALLRGRALIGRTLGRKEHPGVAFYKADELNPAAPVRDNLLFGRVNEGVAGAREQVRELAVEVIEEFGLRDDIERVGLDHQVGPAGRLLTSSQRASVNVIRCIVRRPDILVLDGALASFGERRVPELLDTIQELVDGRSLVAVLPNDRMADRFREVVTFDGPTAVRREPGQAPAPVETGRGAPSDAEAAEAADTPDPAADGAEPTRTAAE